MKFGIVLYKIIFLSVNYINYINGFGSNYKCLKKNKSGYVALKGNARKKEAHKGTLNRKIIVVMKLTKSLSKMYLRAKV